MNIPIKSQSYIALLVISMAALTTGCMKGGGGKVAPYGDGQARGVTYAKKASMGKPAGMVYIPSGMFHMGPSDEDVNFNYSARNKQYSIKGFWMDATEITNSQYLQFVNWVRDSLSAKQLKYVKGKGGDNAAIDWTKARTIKAEGKDSTGLKPLLLPDNARISGVTGIYNPNRVVYRVEGIDYASAAYNRDTNLVNYIYRYDQPVYPDTTVWIRDFSYSYNEPMLKRYFNHPSYARYPVVGVNWKQAIAYCNWRTHYLNGYLGTKKMALESGFRLPTEAEWEYAARGGKSQSMYPWGNYYLRNKQGCLLANFKPGRGNYAEDGGLYTVRVDSYWPNDYGLYNMAGNVAEWTSSYYYESADNFQGDINPDIHYNALDSDPIRMKRKVVRGGSWKDVGYYLQTGTRSFEYQDTARSYIGFRCIIDLPSVAKGNRRRP